MHGLRFRSSIIDRRSQRIELPKGIEVFDSKKLIPNNYRDLEPLANLKDSTRLSKIFRISTTITRLPDFGHKCIFLLNGWNWRQGLNWLLKLKLPNICLLLSSCLLKWIMKTQYKPALRPLP